MDETANALDKTNGKNKVKKLVIEFVKCVGDCKKKELLRIRLEATYKSGGN